MQRAAHLGLPVPQNLPAQLFGLIRDLIADNTQVRIGAAQDLIQGWRNESNVVQALVEFATKNRDNSNGVYNTVVVLYEFTPRSLQAHKEEVLNFLEIAKATGPKTAAASNGLRTRLDG